MTDSAKVYSIGNYGDTNKRFYIEGEYNHVGINEFPDNSYSLVIASSNNSSGNSMLSRGDAIFEGNVGIGYSNLSYKLQVAGTAYILGATTLNSTLSVSGTTTTGNISVGNGNSITLEDNNKTELYANMWYLSENDNHRIYNRGNGDQGGYPEGLIFGNYANNSDQIKFDWNGHVGIGTMDTATYDLNVNGTTYISGATTLNSTLSVNGNTTIDSLISIVPTDLYFNGQGGSGWVTEKVGILFNTGRMMNITFDDNDLEFIYGAGGSRSTVLSIGNSGTTFSYKNVEIETDLTVSGATTLNSTLDVSGISILNSASIGNDGVLNIETISTTYGSETVTLQTSIDNRTLQDSDVYSYASGSDNRKLLCLQPYEGRVGIGKTDPGYTLDVNGTAYISDVTTINQVSSTLSNDKGLLRLKDGYGSELIFGNNTGGNGGIHHLDWYSADSTMSLFYMNYYSNENIRFGNTTTSVSINTTPDDDYALNVGGALNVSGQISCGGLGVTSGIAVLWWDSSVETPIRLSNARILFGSHSNLDGDGDIGDGVDDVWVVFPGYYAILYEAENYSSTSSAAQLHLDNRNGTKPLKFHFESYANEVQSVKIYYGTTLLDADGNISSGDTDPFHTYSGAWGSDVTV